MALGKVLAKWKASAAKSVPVSTQLQMAGHLVEEIVRKYYAELGRNVRCRRSTFGDSTSGAGIRATFASAVRRFSGEGLVLANEGVIAEALERVEWSGLRCGSFFVLWKERSKPWPTTRIATGWRRHSNTPWARASTLSRGCGEVFLEEALRDTRRGSLVEAAETRRAVNFVATPAVGGTDRTQSCP